MALRRRRPLMGAAMLGGAVMAGRHSQRAQYREADQEQRLESLEQGSATPAQPAAQPTAPTEQNIASQLQQLGDLKASGVLNDEEFAAAKQKLLAG